jgi:hypothetical protein
MNVLYSCKNPDHFNAWLNWVKRIKISSNDRVLILSAAEKYIDSRLQKIEVQTDVKM